MKLSYYTLSILNDIENRLDEETEENFENSWRDFLNDKCKYEIFTPKRNKVSKAGTEIKSININDAIKDSDLMLANELNLVSKSLSAYSNTLAIRANYGTGILSSLFGPEIFIMPYNANTLPTTKAFNDNDRIRDILEKGIPDIYSGFGKKVFETGEMYKEVLLKYPNINKYVHVYHPDLQGPLDICELLWGCDMFYTMYDDPDMVHSLLSLITDTYIKFMDKWSELFPLKDDISAHWTIMFKGNIMLRNDSAMNLSPELYKEFALPYDSKLLEYYGGGAIHFCGRGDHYIETMSNIPDLYGINMSQPQLNDMEKIYRNTVDKGIKIIDFSRAYAERDVIRTGGFKGRVHVK